MFGFVQPACVLLLIMAIKKWGDTSFILANNKDAVILLMRLSENDINIIISGWESATCKLATT